MQTIGRATVGWRGWRHPQQQEVAVSLQMRFEAEQKLVEHYDSNVKYHSSVSRADAYERVTALAGRQLTSSDGLLDLGCGDGRVSVGVYEGCRCQVLGMDCSAERLKVATETVALIAGDSGTARMPRFKLADVSNLPRPGAPVWSVIALFETLEHLTEPATVIKHLFNEYLMEGGVIVGSVPLRMPYKAHLQVFADAADVVSRLGVEVVSVEGPFCFFRLRKQAKL